MRRVLGLLWIPGVVALFTAGLPALAAEAPACADCHADVGESFAGSAHGKAFAHDPAYGKASCLSCHAGGEKHAESGDPADVVSPKKAKIAANAACLSCHENRKHNALWQGSGHEAAGLGCVDCHAVHSPRLLRGGAPIANTNELCLSCHATTRIAMTQRSRHPLREGKLACVSCHNPHGAATEKLVAADSVNDLCFSCHQELRGPFLWEHSPVREDCLTCHRPHGSNHDKLLVARAAQLCQSCHLQGRHQTVAGLDSSVWNSNRSCLNCHSQIHGSNHPSGPLFQR